MIKSLAYAVCFDLLSGAEHTLKLVKTWLILFKTFFRMCEIQWAQWVSMQEMVLCC